MDGGTDPMEIANGMYPREPDVLAAEDFFETFGRGRGKLGREQLLLFAVLEDAVACYQRYAGAHDPQGQQLFQETREWLLSTDQGSLFTFESICDVLGIDADYLRRGLEAWRERVPRGGRRPEAAPAVAQTHVRGGSRRGRSQASRRLRAATR